MNEQPKYTILYVDDEESNLRIFKNTFRRQYNILTATSGMEGLELLNNTNVDLILTDQRMPGMSGVDFLKQAIQQYPELNRILVTAYSDYDILRDAVNELKIFQYVEKPWKEEDIKTTIDSALEIHRLRMENMILNKDLQNKNKELLNINKSLKYEIEEHKNTQSELIKEKEFAEQCNRLKSAFLANMSHEIRTPMNSIVGFSSILRENIADSETMNRYLSIIEKSSYQLLTIVSDIIEISKIDTGNIEIKIENVDVNPIIEAAYQANIVEANTKGIELSLISLLPYGHSQVMGEATKITKVLMCLLSNALKFTTEGTVTFWAQLSGSNALFTVSDTGIGVDPAYQNMVFDRFFQIENPLTRKYGGNGLGLSISKAYIEKMGGEIWIEQTNNSGTTFSFTLPLADSKK
jgi:K+-sensing histidine kinase KdpD